MPDVLIRSVPDVVLTELKRWAAEHRRSLQAEVLTILEQEVDARRRREQFFREATELRMQIAQSGPQQTDSVDLIREDRER